MNEVSKQRTLTMQDRRVLAERWGAGDSAVSIAVALGVCPATVYAELKRGDTGELDNLSRPRYSPELGQETYQANLRNRGRRRASAK